MGNSNCRQMDCRQMDCRHSVTQQIRKASHASKQSRNASEASRELTKCTSARLTDSARSHPEDPTVTPGNSEEIVEAVKSNNNSRHRTSLEQKKSPMSNNSNNNSRHRTSLEQKKSPMSNNNSSWHRRPLEQKDSRMSAFKANDRTSLAEALQDYEGSSHTASTRSSDSAVFCIVRSDKLAFRGSGIRRHSRRKRQRSMGNDNTRIIVLRKPNRRDTTMQIVDERIPMKSFMDKNPQLKGGNGSSSKSRSSNSSKGSSKHSDTALPPKPPTKKTLTSKSKEFIKKHKSVNMSGMSPKKVRTPSILGGRNSSEDFSDVMIVEGVSGDILKMSVSSREFYPIQ